MAAELPQQAGIYDLFLEKAQGRYALSIPGSYERTRASPLILVLHWGGPMQPYRGEAVLKGLALPALESLEAIIFAPDCPDQDWVTARSENLILTLVDEVKRALRIATGRCLITGYSMGGTGSWYMAAKHQDHFSAAIAISAMPPPGMAEVSWRIPLYLIHSTDDEIFPVSSTRQIDEILKARDAQIEMIVVKGITHFNVAGYTRHLRDAIPWIRQAWAMQTDGNNSQI